MSERAYVLDKDGRPLMPSKRLGRIRHLLKDGLAKIVSRKPFTIQMLYNSTSYTQPLYGGIDPGRTNIGAAVVNTKGEVVYASVTESKNKDVPKHMAERRIHRQARRRGERLVRKRRAAKCGTTTEFPNGRKLSGYEDGILQLKDIINSEAKFNNRKRKAGWITPTARHCVQIHLNLVEKINKILPVTCWTLEANKFAFMKMEDGSVKGVDFQNGRMKGFESAKAYIAHLQHGKCAICGKPIEHYHHLIPRSKDGNNLPENLVGLCKDCHEGLHTKKISKELEKIGQKKKYGALSILNISIPFIYEGLIRKYGEGNTLVCSGHDTSLIRGNAPKEHWIDAACIASSHADIEPDFNAKPFKIVQFRKHNRAKIHSQHERSYKLNGLKIAVNRKPRTEQKGDSLDDWQKKMINEFGEKKARQMLSKLTVSKSLRHYNDLTRDLPGSMFQYDGKQYVLVGQRTNGQYYLAFGEGAKNFPAKKCKIVLGVRGLQYV